MLQKKENLLFNISFYLNDESIYIETEKLNKCIDYIKRNNIRSIVLNSEYGFKSCDLLFLKEILFIEELIVETDISKIDVSIINQLVNVKSLIIQSKCSQDIFLDKFHSLENCNLIYNSHIKGIDLSISIKELKLWNYSNDNLLFLSKFDNLKKLYIYLMQR